MKGNKNLLKILLKTISKSKLMTCVTLVMIALSVISMILPPLVLENIINRLTNMKSIPLFIIGLYFGFIAIAGLLDAGQNVMITVFGQRITHGLRSAMCEKLYHLHTSFFTNNPSGKTTSRFINDVDAIDSLFTKGIISMFADICKVMGILGVIFYKSTGLGIIMAVVLPLIFLFTRVVQKKMLKAQVDNRIAIGKVNNHLPETVSNIRMIQTLYRQKYMEKKYDRYIQESYSAMDRSNFYDSVYSPIIIFISACVISAMMICASFGGHIQEFFGITVGTAVAIIAYVGKIFSPLESIGMEIQNIQSAVAGVKRINELLQEKERHIPSTTLKENLFPSSNPVSICFEDVAFSYGDEHLVLDNICFNVNAGEDVIFTGRTGAGKSTIFRLLLGLYTPNKGSVLINGVDAKQIPDKEKRRIFGYVEQSFKPVPGTIADQISIHDMSISRDQIEKAAKLVDLHDSILSLPQRYDTPLKDSSLSQGQLQLLSIARAVVTSPKVMLLDEITANLDSDTENKIMTALQEVSKGRAVMSISHRPDIISKETRIIHIEG